MRMYRVSDVNPEVCLGTKYDAVFCSSGYEDRCIYVPQQLSDTNRGKLSVLGFNRCRDDATRLANDKYYREAWGVESTLSSGDDDSTVYEVCRGLKFTSGNKARILVDYSSMSRLWYAGILNWARFAVDVSELVIDFVYAFGQYADDRAQMVIDDILAIPGCEGGPIRLGSSVAVFGLGFDHQAALCVIDRLEPDLTYSYLASPASMDPYSLRVRDVNKELIAQSRQTVDLPLGSVERTYASLVELITPHIQEADVTFVPMGPKPHVMAAILLAFRFEEVACLRVSGKREAPESVRASGKLTATRVEFRRSSFTRI